MITEFRGEYRFLSSFYNHAPFTVPWWKNKWPDPVPTREHAFQAEKAVEWDQAQVVLRSVTAGQAKRAGQLVTMREDWDSISKSVMFHLIGAQIKQHSVLRRQLLATGTEILVEGNRWHDKFWGACSCSSCHAGVGDEWASDNWKGTGDNWLGRIWMMHRDLLR